MNKQTHVYVQYRENSGEYTHLTLWGSVHQGTRRVTSSWLPSGFQVAWVPFLFCAWGKSQSQAGLLTPGAQVAWVDRQFSLTKHPHLACPSPWPPHLYLYFICIWVDQQLLLTMHHHHACPPHLAPSSSLGALRAPTSRCRPLGPLDFVLRALRPSDPLNQSINQSIYISESLQSYWSF